MQLATRQAWLSSGLILVFFRPASPPFSGHEIFQPRPQEVGTLGVFARRFP